MSLNPDTAPPAKAPSARMMKGLANLAADQKKLAELQENADKSTWFDPSAPATRKYREIVRGNFEAFVQEVFGKTEIRAIWSQDTFIQYSKQYIEAMIILSAGGRISKEGTIRSDLLWKHKDGLYYQALRFVDSFGNIYPNWHGQLSAHIHYLGRKYELEQGHRQKNNLTDAELLLFYRELMKFHQGVDNWKQHYAAWLLSWITGVRPGSITVCPGYEKGDSLGRDLVRPDDETMRWSDLTFFHFANVDGIAVRIVFKYLKNQRNPYTRETVVGKKTFTFLPTKGDRYELDPSAVLLGLAFSRGLFPFKTLDELLQDERQNVPTVPAVAKQAVFVAANQANDIDVTIPMREKALNPKLLQMCMSTGLTEHNTMYSFRRTAIIEIRRAQGTEFTREVAGHQPESRSIINYDTEATQDVDITALRLGENGVSREDIRAAFRQVETARIDPTDLDLTKVLRDRTQAAAAADPSYQAMEQSLYTKLSELATLLDLDAPQLGGTTNFQRYREKLQKGRLYAELKELDDLLAQRKALRKTLSRKHAREQKEQMSTEHQKRMQKMKKAIKQPSSTAVGVQPAAMRELAEAGAADVSAQIDTSEEAVIAAMDTESLTNDDDEEPNIDVEAVDEALDGTREEPAHWSKLDDDVIVQGEGDEDATGNAAKRVRFLKSFITLASVATTGLKCMLCALDPTAAEPGKTYTKSKLDHHLRSNYHTRAAELLRAATNSAVNNKLTCPLCEKVVTRAKWVEHVGEEHFEYL